MSGNGTVIPLTPLAVDFWHVRKCPSTRLFFLSHMHSDHTVGLTSTWSDRPIYCSPLSAALLKLKLQVKEQWIHPLELDEPYTFPLDDIGKERLTVTLIDANHCPGSVMFLFQGYFGTILYTGDFRYAPSILRTPCLRNDVDIDVLYLDNTNCDPTRVLPTRRRAAEKIKELIRSHPDHDIVIGLYSLGKETLLVDLAMEFKSWVEVSSARMETLRLLDLPNVFTTEAGAGRLKVVEQASVRYAAVQQWNTVSPTLAILPTSRPVAPFHSNIHVVPYSDHSSYRELEDFIAALKPASLIPIVGDCLPGCLSALLPRRKRRDVLIPESVQNFMLKQQQQQQPSAGAVQQRHRRPAPWSSGPRPCPRGVVFESPPRSSEVPSNVGWRSIGPCGGKEKEGIRRLCGPHAVNALVAEETAAAESSELCEFSQSNLSAVRIMKNIVPSLTPVPRVRGARSAPGKPSGDGAAAASDRGASCSRGEPANFPEEAGVLLSCEEEEEEAEKEEEAGEAGVAVVLLSCEEVEEMEGSILQRLPFSQEDAGRRGVLDHGHVRQFCLTPSAAGQEDKTLFM